MVEIRYGKCSTAAAIWKTGSNLQNRFSRICVFHTSAKVASKKPAFMHEAMGVMLADFFHFQVDYITADANMAAYCTGGTRQGSLSICDLCFQKMVRSYLKAYNAAQNGILTAVLGLSSPRPITLLRWMEHKFGVPWKNVDAIDWKNVPGLDCMVAFILEWSHSIPMEIWSTRSRSEWLLYSNRDVCMLRRPTTLTLLFLFI